MKEKKDFKLIEGIFSPAEAGKILYTMISHKINYHSIELFSSNERLDGNATRCKQRMEELKVVDKSIRELLAEAKHKGQLLKINSKIEITVLE